MRVLIAEDQVLLREGLARLFLDGGHEVVATLGDAELLIAVVTSSPDLVSSTSGCHRRSPTRAPARPRPQGPHPDSACSCCPSTSRPRTPSHWCRAGGFGYLLKDRVLDVAEFLATAERVAAGGSALDPKVVASLVAPVERRTARAAVRPRSAMCSS